MYEIYLNYSMINKTQENVLPVGVLGMPFSCVLMESSVFSTKNMKIMFVLFYTVLVKASQFNGKQFPK